MASSQQLARLEVLVWVLIYGGLFGVILGLVLRPVMPATGWSLFAVGLVAVAAGVVMLWLRSRLKDDSAGIGTNRQ